MFIGLLYWKQERRSNNITLDEEFNIIERHLYQNRTNNQNHIFLFGVLDARIGNGEEGIPTGNRKITPNAKRLINLTNHLNLNILS